jgi:SAM-dependent methyltransferase
VTSLTYSDHAWLYDAAFSWDVSQEVAWLIAVFGPETRRVLETGCGSGRMMPDFARRGIEVVGVDSSEVMLARAKSRMRDAGLAAPTLLCANMADFRLADPVDGALCPIQTFGYLKTRDAALRHLSCVSRALAPGGKYLVQLGLEETRGHRAAGEPNQHSQWVEAFEGRRFRTSWFACDFDPETLIEREICRFEMLDDAGRCTGEVYEDEHALHVWSWQAWCDVLRDSDLRQTAAYDGREAARPSLPLGESLNGQPLVWHELSA